MIRFALPQDIPGILTIVTATGLLDAEQIQELSTMLTQALDDEMETPGLWITDEETNPVGVAYVAPERMTHGTWNLYLLAVRPESQRQGRGRALLSYIEDLLIARRERVLLVETSGTDDFAYVRQFYGKSGYQQEAIIRDFYDVGVDKVIYRKPLA